jgi:hypothetical protein
MGRMAEGKGRGGERGQPPAKCNWLTLPLLYFSYSGRNDAEIIVAPFPCLRDTATSCLTSHFW